MEELKVTSTTDCTATVTTRAAQNNQTMLECILSSLTEACFYKICNEDTSYTVPLGEQSPQKNGTWCATYDTTAYSTGINSAVLNWCNMTKELIPLECILCQDPPDIENKLQP